MSEVALTVEDVWKRFRIYQERNQYLKASLLRGRRARYEEFWAVKGVSFEVKHGEVFGIIGENGSGKSTLLKCMAGILRPDKGQITAHGRLSALLELGAGFHPELSGRENVYLNGAILGLTRKDMTARFDDIVEFSGLSKFIDQPVKNYSSGMYVRLGFAVAINIDPDILLIDEVLAVGDASFQLRCAEKFAEMRNDGKTLIIVTHDLGSIRALCDRAMWLQYGVMHEPGGAAEVVDTYADETLAERVVDDTGEAITRWGSGEVQVEAIELIGPEGTTTTRVRTGDDIILRLHFTAKTPVRQPVFSIEIAQLSGVVLSSPTSRDAGEIPDVLSGKGTVDIVIPKLTLLHGTYDVHSTVRDFALLHQFDHFKHALRFDVLRGTPTEETGIVTLNPRWVVPSS